MPTKVSRALEGPPFPVGGKGRPDGWWEALKERLRYTPLHDVVQRYRARRELAEWERRGRPVPPPHVVKQRVLCEHADRFELRTLIETGTYLGAMVHAMRDRFARIVSIEVDRTLCEKAQRTFARYPHVTIVHGDSGVELPVIVRDVAEPCLFWLDGHYSGGMTSRGELDTPIGRELECILEHPVPGHVVLIDDARLFVGENGYPRLAELVAGIGERRPTWTHEVRDDILRLYDPRPPSVASRRS